VTEPVNPAGPGDPIVLDSSVLVAYERMKSPGAYSLNETQSLVSRWLVRSTPLLMPGLSLTVAAHECGGQLPELNYLIDGDPELVLVVPLAREAAAAIGADSGSLRGEDLEVAHVVWCAAGFDDTGPGGPRWPIATHWPDWYAGKDVPTIAL